MWQIVSGAVRLRQPFPYYAFSFLQDHQEAVLIGNSPTVKQVVH